MLDKRNIIKPTTIALNIILLALCSCCEREKIRLQVLDCPSNITDLNDSEIVFVLKNNHPDIYKEILNNKHDRGGWYSRGFVTEISNNGSITFEFLRSFPENYKGIDGRNVIIYKNGIYKAKAVVQSLKNMTCVAIIRSESMSENAIEIGDLVLVQ